jgi:hypothetical protein
MRRIMRVLIIVGVTAVVSVLASSGPAAAVIHEQVAAYCSGGGHGIITSSGELEPPGIADPTKQNFARPVIANGVVDPATLQITDHPAAKFPAGTSVFDANVGTTDPDHPSAHCAALQ